MFPFQLFQLFQNKIKTFLNHYYINYMEKKRKVKAFFTIDPDLYKDFEKHIEEKLLDKSKLIEHLVKQYLDKQ